MSGVSLRIHVKNADNLPALDDGGMSNPYVACTILPRESPEFRTRVIEQCLDPVWDEDHEIKDYRPGDDLHFKVVDEDNAIKQILVGDDLCGEVVLESHSFYPHGFEGEIRLENVPNGNPAILRLSISVDDGEAMLPIPPTLPPSHTISHGSIKPRKSAEAPIGQSLGDGTETKGGSSCSSSMPPHHKHHKHRGNRASRGRETPTHPHKPSGAVRRISVTLASAAGLEQVTRGRCDPYCVCEVQGSLQSKFRTEVVSDSVDPFWDKTIDFDYSSGEPLVFSLYHKEVWPKKDTLLGRAVLSSDRIIPDGFDGELRLETDDTGGRRSRSGPSLRIQVDVGSASSERPPAQSSAPAKRGRQQTNHPEEDRPITINELMSKPLQSASVGGTERSHDAGSQKIVVCIQSFRGLHGNPATRYQMCCSCGIAGHSVGLRTGFAAESGYQISWNYEGELRDFSPKDDVEFFVTSQGGEVHGGAVLHNEQFYPFGYSSDITISSPGCGIIGLLRVKLVIPKEEPSRVMHSLGRTVGLEASRLSGLTNRTTSSDMSRLQRYEVPPAAEHGLGRHKLSAEGSVIKAAPTHCLSSERSAVRSSNGYRLPSEANAGLSCAQAPIATDPAINPPAGVEKTNSWVVPANTIAAPASAVTSGPVYHHADASISSLVRPAVAHRGGPVPGTGFETAAYVRTASAIPQQVAVTTGAPPIMMQAGVGLCGYTTTTMPLGAVTSYSYSQPNPATIRYVPQPCTAAVSYSPPVVSGVNSAMYGGAPVGAPPGVMQSPAASLLADARTGLSHGLLSLPGVLPPAFP